VPRSPEIRMPPPETAKEKKDQPMTKCGAVTIMSWKGSEFLKIELLE
jgi:hypothetical protein